MNTRRFTSLLLSVSVCLSVLFLALPSANAETLDPYDYITDVRVDGTTKTFYVDLSCLGSTFRVIYAGTPDSTVDKNVPATYSPDGTVEFTWYGGYADVEFVPGAIAGGEDGNTLIPNSWSLEDIPSGASFDFSLETPFRSSSVGYYRDCAIGLFYTPRSDFRFASVYYSLYGVSYGGKGLVSSVIDDQGDGGILALSYHLDAVPDGTTALGFSWKFHYPDLGSMWSTGSTVSFKMNTVMSFTYDQLEEIIVTQGQINDTLLKILEQATKHTDQLQEIIDLLNKILDNMGSGCDHSQIEALLDECSKKLDDSLSWLEKIWNAIKDIPGSISSALADSFTPSDGKVDEALDKAEDLMQEHLGGVYQAGEAVGSIFSALTVQDTQNTVTFPAVSLNLAGVPFAFGGWEVDVVPDQLEFLADTCKLAIDIICTLAFANAMKNRIEKILEGRE